MKIATANDTKCRGGFDEWITIMITTTTQQRQLNTSYLLQTG